MVYSLQSLRAVFALFIFFHHLDLFEAGGSCGVSFFLMLSGFAMTAGYGERVGMPDFSWKRYMLKRLIRVYPLHLITLVLALWICVFLSEEIHVLGWNIAANVLLLQSWVPRYDYFFSGNAVAWCLSDLLFFYAVFPCLYRVGQWLGQYLRLSLVLALVLLVGYIAFSFLLPEKYGNQLLYIHPLFRLIDFVLGMCCFQLYKLYSVRRFSVFQSTGMEFFSLFLLFCGCWTYYQAPLNMTYALIFWLPVFLVILAFALGERNGGLFSRFLCLSVWKKPAALSFSFYMVHQLCIRMLEVWMPDASMVMRVVVGLIFSSFLTVLFYLFWEEPVTRKLLQVYRERTKK